MNALRRLIRAGNPKATLGTILALAGFATAALVGVAIAKTFTLHVAKNAKVTNQSGMTKSEGIVVTSSGRAVYALSGDSKTHPKCTKANGCFRFWPPVTVSSPKKLSKAPGIAGKLGTWHRNGFFQVTLNGHPLYRFALDSQPNHATGEGIMSFGGTWHAVKDPSSASGSTSMPGGTTSTMTTTTMTTTPTCLYPPCY